MERYQSIAVNFLVPLVLSLMLSLEAGFAPVESAEIPAVDEAMATYVARLKERGSQAARDRYGCQVTAIARRLEKSDPYSILTPHEITFYYLGHKILALVNSTNEEPPKFQCLKADRHVYLFLDTLGYESNVRFKLPGSSYVIWSSDDGSSWGALKNLRQFSEKEDFVLTKDQLFHLVNIVGDAKGYAVAIYNRREQATYLFDPEFNSLRVLRPHQRLSPLDGDFVFHGGILYVVWRDCSEQGCYDGGIYLEISKDYGRTWSRTVLPYISASQLSAIGGSLYHFFARPCSASFMEELMGFIPALNPKGLCGEIAVTRIEGEGRWSTPKVLVKSAKRLIGVYDNSHAIMLWQDVRFHRPRGCGYIPLVGCVDSGPFQGPDVVFAGQLDLKTLTLKESVIQKGNESIF